MYHTSKYNADPTSPKKDFQNSTMYFFPHIWRRKVLCFFLKQFISTWMISMKNRHAQSIRCHCRHLKSDYVPHISAGKQHKKQYWNICFHCLNFHYFTNCAVKNGKHLNFLFYFRRNFVVKEELDRKKVLEKGYNTLMRNIIFNIYIYVIYKYMKSNCFSKDMWGIILYKMLLYIY